jgi:hypothetical protein
VKSTLDKSRIRIDNAAGGTRSQEKSELMGSRPGCLLLVVFATGAVAGAGVMFYLLQLHLIKLDFDPGPFVLCWLFIAGAWLLGRALGHHKEGRHEKRPPIGSSDGLEQAIQRRRGTGDEQS